MKIRVHYPEDMTEIYKKMDDFKAKRVVKEYTPQQVDAIIGYFREMKEEEKLEGKKINVYKKVHPEKEYILRNIYRNIDVV